MHVDSKGVLDTSIGSGGTVKVAANVPADGSAIAVQADGKIVVATQGTADTMAILFARYQPDGTLDNAFGDQGMAQVEATANFSPARAIAIRPDGRIVIAGDGQLFDVQLVQIWP